MLRAAAVNISLRSKHAHTSYKAAPFARRSLMAKWFGYAAPDIAGHTVDYGTKFLAGAGLLNILAMVDTFEIASGRKQ
jgi:hypothetical protein